MTIEMLKQNIEREKQIVKEILDVYRAYTQAYNNPASRTDPTDLKFFEKSLTTLFQQLRILNNAVPEMLNGIVFFKPLPSEKKQEIKVEEKKEIKEIKIEPKKEIKKIEETPEEKKAEKKSELINVKYIDDSTKKTLNVSIKKKDEMAFLKNLAIYKFLIKKFKKEKNLDEENPESKIMQSYINLSNKFFRNYANKLVEKKYFDEMKLDLRKIASHFIINSYVAVMIFSFFVAMIPGLFFSIILGFLFGIPAGILAFIFIPLLVVVLLYFYPSSTKKSLEKEINQELPFLVIYMAAISTSGIEPSKIFNILVMSKDYPYTRREIKKLSNYINFYGYDLVTALKAVSKNCPSSRFAQLFDGFSTAITSGGSLTDFLNKHSDSLLFDYRLEREKYTRTAETFMNIYISVVIAAPMIMMMLFILMSMTSLGGGGLGISTIGMLTVLVISMINVAFLVLLNAKQPKF